MIGERDQRCFRRGRESPNTNGNRSVHLALGVGVDNADNIKMTYSFPNLFRSMAQHDHDRIHTALAKIRNARLDDGLFTEGKQRFEGAHPLRAAGGENYCCYIVHDDSGLQVAQSAQCVLPRHLLAPLVDEIGVVEWAGFDVSGFSGGGDLIFC